MNNYHIASIVVITILVLILLYFLYSSYSTYMVGIKISPTNSNIREVADLINLSFEEQKPFIKMGLGSVLERLKSMPPPADSLSCKAQIASAEAMLAQSPTSNDTALNILKVISRASCTNDKPDKEKIIVLLEATIASL